MILNSTGKIIVDYWNRLPDRFPNIRIDEVIVMPNHAHGIIAIVGAGLTRSNDKHSAYQGRGDLAPTLGHIIAYFKYGTTKQINVIFNTPGARLWQRNYYDSVIRNESDLLRIREYIINNPILWARDDYYLSPSERLC